MQRAFASRPVRPSVVPGPASSAPIPSALPSAAPAVPGAPAALLVPFAALADHTPVLMGLTELELPAGDGAAPDAGAILHVYDNPASCRF